MAAAAAGRAAASAFVAVVVGMTLTVELVVGVGMLMTVLVGVAMLVGMGDTVVGVLVGMGMLMAVAVIATGVVGMNVHSILSLHRFSVIIPARALIVNFLCRNTFII